MLKKTVTYQDIFDPETTRTEDCYFNLTKSEIMKLEMGVEGGFSEKLKSIARSVNAPEIMDTFNMILLKAYGKREGNKFVKSDEISHEFEQSPAYDQIFMELVTNAEAAAKFINAIVPEDMRQSDSDVVDFARKQLN